MRETYPLGAISYYMIHTLHLPSSEVPVTNLVFQFLENGNIVEYVHEEKEEGMHSYFHSLYGLYQYSKYF
jgi:hypothetical protein